MCDLGTVIHFPVTIADHGQKPILVVPFELLHMSQSQPVLGTNVHHKSNTSDAASTITRLYSELVE